MCKKCVENIMRERYRIILAKKIKSYCLSDLERLTGKSRTTIWRWERRLANKGLSGLIDINKRPNHHPQEYSPYIKFLIRELRNKYHIGPDKIKIKLVKYFNINISVSGIAKELRRSGLVISRKKKRKNICHYSEKKRYLPGDIIQLDVKFVFKTRKSKLFLFSSIDNDTRIALSRITESSDNYQAIRFLKRTKIFYPFKIKIIQTDNAPYFTNYYTGYTKSTDPEKPKIHLFDQICDKLQIEHYLIDKGKPAQNGRVERFHRTLDDEFFSRYRFRNQNHLLSKFREYLHYYNHQREHLGLDGLTPLEKLRSYPQYKHIKYLL